MKRTARLELGPGLVLAAALVYFVDRQGLFTVALFAALVHELGHYAALRLFGVRPTLLRLELTGALLCYPAGALSYGREALVAAAGPLAGALLAAAAGALGLKVLAGLSALLTVFNLLPASTLDGGRLLRALLLDRLDRERAERFSRAVSIGTALCLLLGGLTLTLTIRLGWSLLIAGAALLIREFST